VDPGRGVEELSVSHRTTDEHDNVGLVIGAAENVVAGGRGKVKDRGAR
jgi:hypothetical protein